MLRLFKLLIGATRSILIKRRFIYSIKASIKKKSFIPVTDQFGLRLNLFLPGPINEKFAGGYATAIAITGAIAQKSGLALRVISEKEISSKNVIYNAFFKCGFPISMDKIESVSIEKSDLEIGHRELFICTYWSTMYYIYGAKSELSSEFDIKILYLIQDYEPNFYPTGSEWLMSKSTYEFTHDICWIINSSSLKDYVIARHESPSKLWIIPPILNAELKGYLQRNKRLNLNRKNIILIYGRPNKDRNAFLFLIKSLKIWTQKYDAMNWTIFSLGEKHPTIQDGKLKIQSLGMIDLQQYANLLSISKIGICFMLSPHPSYPPLEMSYAGLLTLSNNFENKIWHSESGVYIPDEMTELSVAKKINELTIYANSKQTKKIKSIFGNSDDILDVAEEVIESFINN